MQITNPETVYRFRTHSSRRAWRAQPHVAAPVRRLPRLQNPTKRHQQAENPPPAAGKRPSAGTSRPRADLCPAGLIALRQHHAFVAPAYTPALHKNRAIRRDIKLGRGREYGPRQTHAIIIARSRLQAKDPQHPSADAGPVHLYPPARLPGRRRSDLAAAVTHWIPHPLRRRTVAQRKPALLEGLSKMTISSCTGLAGTDRNRITTC